MAQRDDSIDWGRIPADQRGHWGRWLFLMRWTHGRQTQNAVRETLAKLGTPISPAYYSDLEGGKVTPNADWRRAFERLWGGSADDWDDPWATVVPEADQADVAAAIREQTAVMRELVEAIRADQSRISPEAVTVFLRQLASEGLLQLPDTAPSTDALPQPSEVQG